MWHIGRVLAFGGALTLVVALCGPSEVMAQKKKNQPPPVADNGYGATEADYKAIQNRKDLTGTIVSTGSSVITLRTDNPHMEVNPKYKAPKVGAPRYNTAGNQMMRTYNQLMQDQQRLANARNSRTYQQDLQRLNNDMFRYQQQFAQYQMQMMNQYTQAMARSGANKAITDPNYQGPPTADTATANDPYIVVHSYKEYDLETKENVVVRKMFLPFEYDDEGKVKQYTEKQKSELRGDDKSKPGYKSSMEEIINGMEAKLYLTPPPKKKKDEAADKEKDKDAPPEEVARPTINMIVLTKDAPPDTKSSANPPKKKKNQN
jgi:hypothetical protein